MVYKTFFLIIGLANLLGFALIALSNEATETPTNTKTYKTKNIETKHLASDLKKVS
ncbi:hypothetical protein [Clostridium brassicae]|uniref:Cyclic lactone autoinducer peptide n=1 Tax=Clostridium brassicae TaxID=2999072 RepID=A0ABT4DE53_9CLOT|nr:hypothetical protein [Clostridium brassicae]MCY6960582.1 hypothetical protein [Clostridium brassicae]